MRMKVCAHDIIIWMGWIL